MLPLVIGNLIVISYILTNHSLSPLTEINDPLVNSLSVTLPRVFEKLHLNFGLHVEHHLFPSMSSHYAPLVRDELVRRWPERYQSLPLFTALGAAGAHAARLRLGHRAARPAHRRRSDDDPAARRRCAGQRRRRDALVTRARRRGARRRLSGRVTALA